MTKEEFKTYTELQEKFAKDVERVVHVLEEVNSEVGFINLGFYLEDETVFTRGDEHWAYGGYEEHSGCFDANMLTWTDKELREYVDQIKKEQEKERLAKEKEKQKEIREKELAELKRLREKYE